ncbi:hypothetical protein SIID45300_03259 [Candidatus Magnetaquicoccaceae bacterium FCR-1]|uniref:Bacterial type II secretion system protein E domain-containing protein n=1 Tax=Candidatus Magnetaquiglobus chichijimensis TaxID=3141448 RepID=A0ABQ0CDH9_9PROT
MTTLTEILSSDPSLRELLDLSQCHAWMQNGRKSLWSVLLHEEEPFREKLGPLFDQLKQVFLFDHYLVDHEDQKEDLINDLMSEISQPDWLTTEGSKFARILILSDLNVPADRVDALNTLKPGNHPQELPLRFIAEDPWDPRLRSWLRRKSGRRLLKGGLIRPALLRELLSMLATNTPTRKHTPGAIHIDPKEDFKTGGKHAFDAERKVKYFLAQAIRERASDIHLDPTDSDMQIRMRVDGLMREMDRIPRALHPELIAHIKILARMDVVEKRRPQDGSIEVNYLYQKFDIRTATYPTIHGEKMVMRILRRESAVQEMNDLGLSGAELLLLKKHVQEPHGLILVSGPTGSGKSTTLFTLLSAIDREERNIMTIEDPVEYRIAGAHQMRVNPKINLTFAEGLRAILRQDPDVIMVGEVRDSETAAMALQASLTGHLVFSTIHTNDAVGVVVRLLNIGIPAYLVASALNLVVAQRLVRLICPQCKKKLSADEMHEKLKKYEKYDDRLRAIGLKIPRAGAVWGEGCSHCRSTGYRGRRAVFELLPINATIQELILAPQCNEAAIRQAAIETCNMKPMVTFAKQLQEKDETTFEEILRVLGGDESVESI